MREEQLDALIHQLVEKGVRYDVAAQDFEKKYIGRVLERSKGNQSRAARLLGMHRNTLSRKISEYDLVVNGESRLGNGNGNVPVNGNGNGRGHFSGNGSFGGLQNRR